MTLWFCIAAAWAQTEVALIEAGSSWRLKAQSPGDTTWMEPGYDDSAWLTGLAQLGFGEQDQARTVFPNPADPYTTLYLRRSFTVGPPQLDTLVLDLLVDDGALVWLNGQELLRQNLPAGPIGDDTLALSEVDGPAENRFSTIRLPSTGILPGENVLAVEVHQAAADSDDLSFDLRLTATDGALRITRGPYLQLATPTSMTVRFRTDDEVPGSVWVGSSPTALDRLVTGPAAFEHEIRVDGLEPGSTWYYAVGSGQTQLAGGDAEHRFTTPPPVGEASPTRVWVIGDAGTANASADAVYQAYGNFTDRETDLWLMLGDNAYEDGTDAEYQAAVFEMYPALLARSPVWPTIGNHDGHASSADGMIGPYFDAFTLPMAAEAGGVPSGTEAYYSFDHGNIHFIVLDSYSSELAAGSAQWTWLEEDLLATGADWLIALWHHPPYTHGTHNSDFELNHVLMRAQALPLLEAHGVDLVLGGHSHGYERSMLIDGHYGTSVEFDASHIVDGRLGQDPPYAKPAGLQPHEGAIYVVAGSSGKFGLGTYSHPVHLVSMPTLGSMVLDIDGDRLDAQFLDSTGAVLDHFALIKEPDPANPGDRAADEPGCGCQSGGGWPGLGLLLLLALFAGRARAHPTNAALLEATDARLELDGCDLDAWRARARILAEAGALDEALQTVDAAAGCRPLDPGLAAERGTLLLRLDRPEEARAELEYAAMREPGPAVLATLARAQAATGQCALAAATWEHHRALAAHVVPDSWLSEARALRCDGRTSAAAAVLSRAIGILGPIPALERERIELWIELGQHERALEAARAMWARSPRSPTWRELVDRIDALGAPPS